MALLTKNTAEFRARVQEHIAADAVVGGHYWEKGDTAVGGTGCFIGCTTHSDNPKNLEDMWGFPLMLAKIVENIFEGLPIKDQPLFFGEIGAAMSRDGADLTRVPWAFLAEELRALPKMDYTTQAAIDTVIAGMDLLASGKEWPRDAAARAADYAYVAADADAAAAYVAARAADYADADADADAAAYAAAYVADYAADYAAARQRQRETIVRLIVEACAA